MKLTKNFSIEELTYTNPDLEKRFGLKNTPNEEQLERLKDLAENVLQPIREHFKIPIRVTSGFRSEKYNDIIGGENGSQHTKGMAVDIDVNERNREIFFWVIENLNFDQIIWEHGTEPPNGNPDWIHISYKKKGNRKMVTRAVRKNGKTQYLIIPV